MDFGHSCHLMRKVVHQWKHTEIWLDGTVVHFTKIKISFPVFLAWGNNGRSVFTTLPNRVNTEYTGKWEEQPKSGLLKLVYHYNTYCISLHQSHLMHEEYYEYLKNIFAQHFSRIVSIKILFLNMVQQCLYASFCLSYCIEYLSLVETDRKSDINVLYLHTVA